MSEIYRTAVVWASFMHFLDFFLKVFSHQAFQDLMNALKGHVKG